MKKTMEKVHFSIVLTVVGLAWLTPGCTVYKTINVTSEPSGLRVHKDGVIIGTTPFDLRAGAGDCFFCTPWYWSFTLEIDPPIGGQNARQKLVNPCAIPDGATVHFDMRIPGSVNEGRAESKIAMGTGFAISSEGHIVTVYHVIKGRKIIKVYLTKDSFVSAKVIHGDPMNDLAVLKMEKATTSFLQVAPMRSVKAGDRVFTIGFPVSSVLGQEAKYTEGVVSSLSGLDDASTFLQISVPVQPGNSGGALVDENGQVVGIITSTAALLPFIKESGTLPQNVNWAVKADYLRPLIELPKAEQKQLNREQAITLAKKSTFLIEAE